MIYAGCVRGPNMCTFRTSELLGNTGQAVACSPAHDAGKGMHTFRPAQFPDARIGYSVIAHRLLTQPFQIGKHVMVGWTLQAHVVKRVRAGHHGSAEDIVLYLLIRQVADPYRP